MALALTHVMLGCALTVLAAWLLAAIAPLQPDLYKSPYEASDGWMMNRWEGVGTTLHSAFRAANSDHLEHSAVRPGLIEAALAEHAITSINEEVRGWPWPCLAYRIIGRRVSVFEGDYEQRGGIPLRSMSGSFTPIDGFEWNFERHRALPLMVQPTEFVGDTIAWAAMTGCISALAIGLTAWRRRLRSRHRRCRACGYDVREAGGGKCSECGQEISTPMLLLTRRRVAAPLAVVILTVIAMGALAAWKSGGQPRLDALHAAARDGDIARVDRLLIAGDMLDAPCHDGWTDVTDLTPLMWAARGGQPMMVKHLLERGADVDAVDSSGQTALHWAAWRGDTASIEALLTAGAAVDALSDATKTNGGMTPLACTILGGPPRRDAAIVLLDAGADTRTKAGGVSLMFWTAAGSASDVELLGAILDRDPSLLEDSRDVQTTVGRSIAYGRLEVLKELARHGCDVAAISRPFTAKAAGSGNVDLIRYLMELGVPVTDSPNHDVMMYACASGNVEVVRLLLAQGADPLERSGSGETILFWGNWGSDPEMARLVFSLGVDVNARASNGMTALMSCAANGWSGALRRLLDAGADPLLVDQSGKTALDYAIARRTNRATEPNPENVRLLEAALRQEEGRK